ncbi:MAG: endonuclease III [Acidimicrobiaceae bacterium]|nr:endonuclease III [Acidimicrobiaceae bacterium]
MGTVPNTESHRRREILNLLDRAYPGTVQELCALSFETPFQLLVATILSAQCTDERVNATTPKVFEHFGTAQEMIDATPEELESLIYSTGFYKNKAKNILAMTRVLLSKYDGKVPCDMESLTALPGVGRKTANVVRSVAFAQPGLPVDTHVGRLSIRLGFTKEKDPVKVEMELLQWVPPEETGGLSLRLILHGRSICLARKPRCDACILVDLCPSSRFA